MEKLVLGEQFGDSFMCFNTSFSWNTYEAFDELADYLKGKTWFQKFDLLLGFTVAISVRTWNRDGWSGGGTSVIVDRTARCPFWTTELACRMTFVCVGSPTFSFVFVVDGFAGVGVDISNTRSGCTTMRSLRPPWFLESPSSGRRCSRKTTRR